MSESYSKVITATSALLLVSMVFLLLPITASAVEGKSMVPSLVAARPGPVIPGPTQVIITNQSTAPIPVTGTVKVGRAFSSGWRTVPNTFEPCVTFIQRIDLGSAFILKYLHITISTNPGDKLFVSVYSPAWASLDVPISYYPKAVPNEAGRFVLDELVYLPTGLEVDIQVCRANLSATDLNDSMSLVGFISGTIE